MIGFATNSNPYTSGMKPKEFFGARNSMIKKEKMLGEVDKNYYPKKDVRPVNHKAYSISDPTLLELFRTMPWIIAVCLAIALMI